MTWNWWVLVVVPVAWFLQNCLHELSHLVVGWLSEGRKPLGFWPYPHKHEGRFYFARFSSGPPSDLNFDWRKKHRLVFIAPFLVGAVWVASSLVAFLMLSPHHRVFALPTAATGLVDALWFWRGYFWGSDRCDGKRWRNGVQGDSYQFDSGNTDQLPLDEQKKPEKAP